MTIRFRRRIQLFPGVSINIGKRGISTSTGMRGAHATISDKGTRTTVGIPGAGLSATEYEPHEHPVSESPDMLAGVSGPEPRGHAIIVWVVIFVLISVGYLAMR